MKLLSLALILVVASKPISAQVAPPMPCSNMSLGPNGALNDFVPSPSDAWHQDVSKSAIDEKSDLILVHPGGNNLSGMHLHPDFSSTRGGAGIPYVIVDGATTPLVPITWTLGYQEAEGDTTLYPIPSNMPIEGKPAECIKDGSDRHAIVIDRNKCVDYEMYQASHCQGRWLAGNGAVWDMTITETRPYGHTSVDAAGLSVFEGLLRYDEIQAGAVNHALRFTSKWTKNNGNNGFFTAPATHAAGNNWGNDMVIGMRLRLKASFDVSRFSPTNQIILRGMKKYGMILADNGGNLYFQGTPDPRWKDDDLNALKTIGADSFEVIQMGAVYDAEKAPKGHAPTIKSFKASASNVTPGQSVTLTAVVNGASYSVIDKAGFVRGPTVVNPLVTTTYKLVSSNLFGRSTASTTVTVIQ